LTLARSTLETLDLASAVLETIDKAGTQFCKVAPFVNTFCSRASGDGVEAFTRTLSWLCPLIDEANSITSAVVGKEELQFELHALTDIFNWSGALPELAVSARGTWQSPGVPKESGTLPNHSRDVGQHGEEPWIHGHAHHVNGRSPLLYVWSLEKFLSRLAAMREINQECAQSDIESVRRRLSQFPCQNPWIEMSFADSRSLGEQNHPSHGLYLDSPSSILSPFEDGSGRTDWRRRLSTDLQGISDELDLSSVVQSPNFDKTFSHGMDSDRSTESDVTCLVKPTLLDVDVGLPALKLADCDDKNLAGHQLLHPSLEACPSTCSSEKPRDRDGSDALNVKIEWLCNEVLHLQQKLVSWRDDAKSRSSSVERARRVHVHSPGVTLTARDSESGSADSDADSLFLGSGWSHFSEPYGRDAAEVHQRAEDLRAVVVQTLQGELLSELWKESGGCAVSCATERSLSASEAALSRRPTSRTRVPSLRLHASSVPAGATTRMHLQGSARRTSVEECLAAHGTRHAPGRNTSGVMSRVASPSPPAPSGARVRGAVLSSTFAGDTSSVQRGVLDPCPCSSASEA